MNIKQTLEEIRNDVIAKWCVTPMTPKQLYDTVEKAISRKDIEADENLVLEITTDVLKIVWL